MPEKLFFGFEGTTVVSASVDQHQATNFTSTYSGLLTSLRVTSSSATGNAKTNIYSGATWSSAALEWADDAGAAISVGSTIIPVTPTAVTGGESYWIGFDTDTAGAVRCQFGGSTQIKAETYASFFAPDPPGAGYAAPGAPGATAAIAAYGWEPPTITTYSPGAVYHGATVSLTGTDFMTSGLTIEVCNNSDYSLASVKNAMTGVTHDDTTATGVVDLTDIRGDFAWVFVTTSLGQRNAVGYGVAIGREAWQIIKRFDGICMPLGHHIVLSGIPTFGGFQIECTTTSPSESVTLPLVTGYTYDCRVDWGEGTPVTVTAWDHANATHVYATPGVYRVTITGTCPAWSVNNTHSSRLQWTGIVYWGDPVDFDGWQYLVGGWYGCANLVSLGSGSILDDGVSSLQNTFRGVATGTTPVSLYAGMLDNLTGVTNLVTAFFGSNLTGSIPNGFFDAQSSVANAARCMQNCSGLSGEIPSLLLEPMQSNAYWNYFFAGCSNLQIRSDILYSDGQQGSRFLNKNSFFIQFFDGCGTATVGTVPDLWSCDFGTGSLDHTNWINGHSASTLSNWYDIPAAWDGGGP